MYSRPTEPPKDKEPTRALEATGGRTLSAEQFHGLTDVPAVLEWLATIPNRNTGRAYQCDVEAYTGFCGIEAADELRLVTRGSSDCLAGQFGGPKAGSGLDPAQIGGLFHELRRTELVNLQVGSLMEHSSAMHLRVLRKDSKTRYLPAHPAALAAIFAYLELAGHGADSKGAPGRPVFARGAIHGSDQRFRKRCGHCAGAGMVRALKYQYNAAP